MVAAPSQVSTSSSTSRSSASSRTTGWSPCTSPTARPPSWAPSSPHPCPGSSPRPSRRTSSAGCCDRPALEQWSKGRATLVGDAAHPTSPYAAYGAGTSIEDGYFLDVAFRGVDLTDAAAVARALQSFEDRAGRTPPSRCRWPGSSARSSTNAPAPLQPIRDFVFDYTPFLQEVAGDSNPREINQQLALIE
ncbi:FAD-dependent monooxygenase [Geodermatophilus sp. TF02-6]|uniref:FAD-dependent monooxygenase n=1 Tax=Geodermatophilus sp. TF02-6 TaxID=2250575 RepID=UPI00351A5226